jgi:magnesium-transporting ATPase (P-type)
VNACCCVSLGFPCVLLQVIADGVFISGSSVKTDEAAITGESDNVNKDTVRDPFMLSGTSMAAGTCNVLVTAVGSRSTQVRWLVADLCTSRKSRGAVRVWFGGEEGGTGRDS